MNRSTGSRRRQDKVVASVAMPARDCGVLTSAPRRGSRSLVRSLRPRSLRSRLLFQCFNVSLVDAPGILPDGFSLADAPRPGSSHHQKASLGDENWARISMAPSHSPGGVGTFEGQGPGPFPCQALCLTFPNIGQTLSFLSLLTR